MPTLFRFLLVIAIIAAGGYAALFALANFIETTPREITVTISPDKYLKP